MVKIKLANIEFTINSKSWTLDRSLDSYIFDFEIPDICCNVNFINKKDTLINDSHQIISSKTHSVYLAGEKKYISYNNEMQSVLFISTTGNWSNCRVFIDESFDNPSNELCAEIIKHELFYSLKTIFFSALLSRNGVLIHAASIEWKGKGILFSAPSGMGKSTHVHLWQEKYGVPILDGDNTACRIVDGQSMAYGLPWCGTSGEFLNAGYPLGAIVFLEQDEKNSIIKLDITEAVVRLYARCFLFSWDEQMVDLALDTITKIVSTTDCYLLKCRPDYEAVELVKICLEKN